PRSRSRVIPKPPRASGCSWGGTPPTARAGAGAIVISVSSGTRARRFGDGDAAGTLVGEPRPRPVDHRLRAVLAGREQRQVHGAPGEPRGLAFHRATAAELHHRSAASDRRHRALV